MKRIAIFVLLGPLITFVVLVAIMVLFVGVGCRVWGR
jgi:hypothetical protein